MAAVEAALAYEHRPDERSEQPDDDALAAARAAADAVAARYEAERSGAP